MIRRSRRGDGFLIEDEYPPGSATSSAQVIVPQVKPAWNEQVSNWLSWLSVALLTVSPVILLWMWSYAWQYHRYPFAPWHSPWGAPPAVPAASEGLLETVWLYAMLFSGGSFTASTLSLIFKPNLRAIVAGGLSIVCGITVLAHIQLLLIDF